MKVEVSQESRKAKLKNLENQEKIGLLSCLGEASWSDGIVDDDDDDDRDAEG